MKASEKFKFVLCSWVTAIAVSTIASTTLVGWLCHLPSLVTPWVGFVTMKANTALSCAACAGALLALLRFQTTGNSRWAGTVILILILPAFISIVTLCEHAGWRISIDQALIHDTISQQLTATPGRMGPYTAASIFLLSLALFLAALNKPGLNRWAIILALIVGGISILSSFDYLYGVPNLYHISISSQMAASSAISFLLMSLGLLCALPEYSCLAVLADQTSGGFIARRLVPFALLTAPIFGFLRLEGQRLGLYGTEFGVALMALLMMFLTTVLAFWISHVVAGKDMTLKYAKELEVTSERLCQANAELERFYALLVHELRTPMTSIRASLSLIQNGMARGKEKQLLDIAMSETERMVKMINELLDLKKIEEGKCELQFAETQPGSIVARTLSALQAVAADLRVDLIQAVHSRQAIVCDEGRIIQTLTNLVSNAIKFAPDSQVATVVEATPFGTKFSVIDHGPGILPDEIPKLFQKFAQLTARNDHYRGSGLGLSISKAIVEQHGGRIGVESVPGRGSTFWFELPAKPALFSEPAEAGTASDSSGQSKGSSGQANDSSGQDGDSGRQNGDSGRLSPLIVAQQAKACAPPKQTESSLS